MYCQFANRFLFALVRRSKLLPSGGNVPEGDLSSFVRVLRMRLTEARKINLLRRSAGAEELWAKIYAQHAEHDPGGLLGAAAARAEAQILRLSVAYALTDASSATRSLARDRLAASRASWRADAQPQTIGSPQGEGSLGSRPVPSSSA